MRLAIDPFRLRKNMEELAEFGWESTGGIWRESFGAADQAAKQWLIAKIEAARLHARQDAAGNVWGRLGPAGPAVLVGSHIDTVPAGGMFDGALGVVAALECLQTIREQKPALGHPLEMVAFSDEEGAFLSFLGSRAAVGALRREELAEAQNMQGVPLAQALAACGLNVAELLRARSTPHAIRAYLELHIEQGPRLEAAQIPIGIVRTIVGIAAYRITFQGEANHAGTTPLAVRKDALLGAAEFALQVDAWVRSHTLGVVTVGNMDVLPGAFNIVPGEVRLALEFREASSAQLASMEQAILQIGAEVAHQRNLGFRAQKLSWDEPVALSPAIIAVIRQEADALGLKFQLMDSGAGHDAQILAPQTEAGMIFIPSLQGKSHCPQENSRWEHIEQGAQLLLNCLLRLAGSESAKA
ncbi:MAG: Zn-dependent hydrolase [Desulfobacterales bacterium]|nr:MAG: Zn-dependent hydrolase [Desulfobacterales bacterium]